MRHLLIFGVAALLLSACATSGVDFSGYTTASKQLRSDTLMLVEPMFLGETNCDRLEAVEADVPAIGGFFRNENVQVMIDGPIYEEWIASGCGQSVKFDITFTPDGKGGAFMSVTAADEEG